MIAYKIKIISRTWNVYYMSNKAFAKKYGSKTLAAAECDDRAIFCRVGYIDVECVAHELMHAYIHEHSAPTMVLDANQIEELCCDIMAKYAGILTEQARMVVHAYKLLRGRRR